MKTASEKEGNLILKTKEILAKYGVFDKPESVEDVFNSLSESEKITCLEGLEVILRARIKLIILCIMITNN
jgi:hypothetical protein